MEDLDRLKKLTSEAGELALRLNMIQSEMRKIRDEKLSEEEKFVYGLWFMNSGIKDIFSGKQAFREDLK